MNERSPGQPAAQPPQDAADPITPVEPVLPVESEPIAEPVAEAEESGSSAAPVPVESALEAAIVSAPIDESEPEPAGAEPVDDDVVEQQAVPATDPVAGSLTADEAAEPESAVVDQAVEPEPEPEAAGARPGPLPVSSELPDLTDDRDLQGAVEALLLVVDSPIEVEAIADALEEPVDRTLEVLTRIAERYAEAGSGIDLRRTGNGWRFYTRDRFAPFVEKLLLDGQRAKLTRAALETLAVIAYRQPVTRSRVAAVRGVNVDGVIRTLLARGLIEEIGTDQETGGNLYRTTELFLERLGLSSLEDLPPLAPLLPEVDAIDDI